MATLRLILIRNALIWIVLVLFLATLSSLAPGIKGSSPQQRLLPLDRFDAVYYRAWSEGTKTLNQEAFFPIYSYTLRPLIRITGIDFAIIASIINIISIIAIAALWPSVGQALLLTPQQTMRSFHIMLLMPAAFVFIAPYPTAALVLSVLIAWLGYLTKNDSKMLIGSSLAACLHSTGIIVLSAAIMFGIYRRAKTIPGWIIVALTITMLAYSVIPTYLAGRMSYAHFDGTTFWQLGWWFSTHAKNPFDLIVAQSTTVLTLVALFYGLLTNKQDTWHRLIGVGILLLTIISSTWMGLPRYELVVFGIAISLSMLKHQLRITTMLILGLLQIAWIYIFASGNFYV